MGSTITVHYTACNHGTGSTGTGFTDAVYLSKDPTITTTDWLIGTIYPNAMAAGVCYYWNANAVIPSPLKPRQYYLGAFVDRNDEVPEANENNNIITGSSIDVQAASP